MNTTPCPVCGGHDPKYDTSTWCRACVQATLDEQHTSDTNRQEPQIIG